MERGMCGCVVWPKTVGSGLVLRLTSIINDLVDMTDYNIKYAYGPQRVD